MRPSLKIRNTFNQDYVGSPTAGAVKVPVRNTDVSVRDYDIKNGIALEQSTTGYLDVLITIIELIIILEIIKYIKK